jgi:hypothetical protein
LRAAMLNWERCILPAFGHGPMISIFKSMWSRLAGGTRDQAGGGEIVGEEVEYKGFRIRPAPYPAGGQYQTAGVIEKEFGAEVKQHRFIRAERHPSADDAMAFAVAKGKQIIDENGDRLFEAR